LLHFPIGDETLMQIVILICDSDFRFLKLFKYAKHYLGLFITHQPLVVMICVHMGCEQNKLDQNVALIIYLSSQQKVAPKLMLNNYTFNVF
jgi:hypothetical protein